MHVLTTVLAVGAVSVLALVAAGPRLGLYRIEAVLSGSMQPTFNPGDLIVVTPEPASDVQVGQVISYQIPIGDHHVESHRIVRILSRGPRPVIVTKGDNNATADPWKARLTSRTAWRERFSIPGVGWMIVWLRQPLVQRITVLGLPCLLAAWWLLVIWRRPRSGEA
jgi:signal peptidase I